jgi:hypothetical protein
MCCTARASHRKAIIAGTKKPLELKLILPVKPARKFLAAAKSSHSHAAIGAVELRLNGAERG